MKKNASRWVSFVVGLLILSANISQVLAQNPNQWQPDERVPGYLDNTFTPYMVVDQNRTVHVFASQVMNEKTFQLAIVYRQWSVAGGWTKATDILLSPSGNAVIQGAFLDQQGFVHVIFWGGTARRLKYTTRKRRCKARDQPLRGRVPWSSGIFLLKRHLLRSLAMVLEISL